jgi:hypothetical protein
MILVEALRACEYAKGVQMEMLAQMGTKQL